MAGASFGAQPAAGQEALRSGIEAFRNNELHRARGFFLQAMNAGLSSAKLFYNLGVVHYRLGDYAAAQSFFRRGLDRPESRQLVQYNLARCAQKMGRVDEANQWYALAMRGGDPRIAELARRARRQLAVRHEPSRNLLFTLKTGFDSAVVGLVDQVTSLPTDNSDLFVEVLVQGLRSSQSDWLGEGQWQVTGYALQYEREQQVNVQSLSLAWSTRRALENRRQAGLQLHLAHEWLDGQSYQLRAGPAIQFSHPWRGMLARYALSAEFLEARDSRLRDFGGVRAEISSALLTKLAGGIALGRLALEVNEREDDFNSPRRYRAELLWRSPRGGSWQLGPGLQWRWSDYPSDVREDELRWRAFLRLDTPLSGVADARVELQYEDNDSDDDRFVYSHFRATLGLSWAY